MMTFPIYGKIRFMFQTTNQLYIYTFSVNVRITMENQHAIVMLLYNLRNPLFLSPFFNSKQFVYQLNYIYIYHISYISYIYIHIHIYILYYIYRYHTSNPKKKLKMRRCASMRRSKACFASGNSLAS